MLRKSYHIEMDTKLLELYSDYIISSLAVSEKDKRRGRFTRIDSLQWSSQKSVRGWLKGLDFPVLLHRQVFTNKDGSTGILYLACSNLSLVD